MLIGSKVHRREIIKKRIMGEMEITKKGERGSIRTS